MTVFSSHRPGPMRSFIRQMLDLGSICCFFDFRSYSYQSFTEEHLKSVLVRLRWIDKSAYTTRTAELKRLGERIHGTAAHPKLQEAIELSGSGVEVHDRLSSRLMLYVAHAIPSHRFVLSRMPAGWPSGLHEDELFAELDESIESFARSIFERQAQSADNDPLFQMKLLRSAETFLDLRGALFSSIFQRRHQFLSDEQIQHLINYCLERSIALLGDREDLKMIRQPLADPVSRPVVAAGESVIADLESYTELVRLWIRAAEFLFERLDSYIEDELEHQA